MMEDSKYDVTCYTKHNNGKHKIWYTILKKYKGKITNMLLHVSINTLKKNNGKHQIRYYILDLNYKENNIIWYYTLDLKF